MGGNHGGFAERLRVNGALAIKLPEGIRPEDAAPLLCAGVTVYAPVSKFVKTPGMKVPVSVCIRAACVDVATPILGLAGMRLLTSIVCGPIATPDM